MGMSMQRAGSGGSTNAKKSARYESAAQDYDEIEQNLQVNQLLPFAGD